MSSGVIGAQYGSTKDQNRLGVSFLGKLGFVAGSVRGRICSFCRGSKWGTAEDWSDLILGMPMT
jgi:hypothetical protein